MAPVTFQKLKHI